MIVSKNCQCSSSNTTSATATATTTDDNDDDDDNYHRSNNHRLRHHHRTNFHEECIATWLSQRRTNPKKLCPCCRQPFFLPSISATAAVAATTTATK